MVLQTGPPHSEQERGARIWAPKKCQACLEPLMGQAVKGQLPPALSLSLWGVEGGSREVSQVGFCPGCLASGCFPALSLIYTWECWALALLWMPLGACSAQALGHTEGASQ